MFREVAVSFRPSPIVVLVLGIMLLLVSWSPGLAQQPDPEAQGPDGPAVSAETALTVGELPPSGFTLSSIDGRTHELEALRGRQALMIVFFRGTW